MRLGLDELIIVNPGSAPSETSWFLGADGGVYRLDPQRNQTALGGAEPVPRYFLSDDGTLYETH